MSSHAPGRLGSVDGLRGLAIAGMILSGAIAFGAGLPAWMYHAQNPPPSHLFDHSISGLTWVDLVYPAFLFSMGLVLPVSVQRRLSDSITAVLVHLLVRFGLLVLLAYLRQRLIPFGLVGTVPPLQVWVLPLAGFAACWLMFAPPFAKTAFRVVGVLLAIGLIGFLNGFSVQGFAWNKSDPILMGLAQVWLVGALLCLLGKYKLWAWLIVALILLLQKLTLLPNPSLFLGPFFKLEYLQFLLILLPGMLLGLRLEALREAKPPVITILPALLIVFGLLASWFMDLPFLALCLATGLLLLSLWLGNFDRLLLLAGGLLTIGSVFYLFEGHIAKGPASLGYLLSAAGFSGLLFWLFCHLPPLGLTVHFFRTMGQNPLLAYLLPTLLVWPIVFMLADEPRLAVFFKQSQALALVKGLIMMAMVWLITWAAKKFNLHWKL